VIFLMLPSGLLALEITELNGTVSRVLLPPERELTTAEQSKTIKAKNSIEHKKFEVFDEVEPFCAGLGETFDFGMSLL